MKGTITIYANSIDKERHDISFDMNLKNVSVTDKFSLVDSLMNVLGFTEKERTVFAIGIGLVGGFGESVERVEFPLGSEEADTVREECKKAVSEE